MQILLTAAALRAATGRDHLYMSDLYHNTRQYNK